MFESFEDKRQNFQNLYSTYFEVVFITYKSAMLILAKTYDPV